MFRSVYISSVARSAYYIVYVNLSATKNQNWLHYSPIAFHETISHFLFKFMNTASTIHRL